MSRTDRQTDRLVVRLKVRNIIEYKERERHTASQSLTLVDLK